MLFPVHWGLGIAPDIEYQVVKVPTALPPILRLSPVSGERIARVQYVLSATLLLEFTPRPRNGE